MLSIGAAALIGVWLGIESGELRSTTVPAIVLLILWPIFMLLPKRASLGFFIVSGLWAMTFVGGLPLAVGVTAAVSLGYWMTERVVRLQAGRRAAFWLFLVLFHAAYWGCFFLPLPPNLAQAVPGGVHNAPSVFVLFSGIGLSFFRLMSYFHDRCAGRIDRLAIVDFLAYMFFFPQFRHGPIERAGEFSAKLKTARERWTLRDGGIGLVRIAYVFVMVFVLAAGMSALGGDKADAETVEQSGSMTARILAFLDKPEDVSPLMFFVFLHAPFFALYVAESLFTHLVLGVARVFGVKGTENYDFPVGSPSPRRVWQRWNISLSRWLGDYVFAPLGGARRRPALNYILTFAYCGLLHGVQLRFVVWGLFAGVSLAIYGWLNGPRGVIKRWIPKRNERSTRRHVFEAVGRVLTLEWCAFCVIILLDYNHCGWRVFERYINLLFGWIA